MTRHRRLLPPLQPLILLYPTTCCFVVQGLHVIVREVGDAACAQGELQHQPRAGLAALQVGVACCRVPVVQEILHLGHWHRSEQLAVRRAGVAALGRRLGGMQLVSGQVHPLRLALHLAGVSPATLHTKVGGGKQGW